jgi:hypothetical protein
MLVKIFGGTVRQGAQASKGPSVAHPLVVYKNMKTCEITTNGV